MSKGRKFNKNGIVNAYDEGHTGFEPDWSNASELTKDQVNTKFSKALNFYTYYLDRDDLHKVIMEFMATYNGKWKAEDIKKVRQVSKDVPLSTEGKIARMLLQGMPDVLSSEGKTMTQLVDSKIAQMIRYTEMHSKTVNEKPLEATTAKAPIIPPMKRLENKVNNEVVCHIDWALDEWTEDFANVAPVNVTQLMSGANIPAKGCQFVHQFIDKYLVDLYDAKSGECEQCVEAYSFLSKRELNKWVKTFEKMKADVDKYEVANKKAIVRTKKVKPAIKQVEKLKYQVETEDIKSVPPVRICGAMTLFTYNTKTNKVAKYQALTRNGFTVKGTSVKDFDESRSYTFTVRKNVQGELFQQLKKKDVAKGVDAIKSSTKTKVATPNGRTNEHTLLLYTK
jgi:hypothetical protein